MSTYVLETTGCTVTPKLVHESGEYACIFPQRYADLKRRSVKEEDEAAVIKAWNEILDELSETTKEFVEKGNALIPQVEFSEIPNVSPEKIAQIKKRGCVLIRNVVDDGQVLRWKEQLRDYVTVNPGVEGVPKGNPQFFEIYWSKPQLQARSHPNVLDSLRFATTLWHSAPTAPLSLSNPLTIGNRLRIREPSDEPWTRLCPHVDHGSVERWEDEQFRSVFEDILKGNWLMIVRRPFGADRRMTSNNNLYNHKAGIFVAFQGWLGMSDTAPGEGTLQVFPDVLLSTSYLILRPLFRMVDSSSPTPLDPSNWILDLENPDFPGIAAKAKGFGSLRVSDETHPHMRVSKSLISIPRVKPGDMMFWHPDVVHAVEAEHHGKGDSSVMYIGAVPLSPQNITYVVNQRDRFHRRVAGQQFNVGKGESHFINKGELEDIHEGEGRSAMGLEKFDEKKGGTAGAKDVIKLANELIASTT